MTKCPLLSSFAALTLIAAACPAGAAPSVADTAFLLSGKFGGTSTVKCAVGGSRGAPIQARRNLSARVEFKKGGTFVWTSDTLSPAPVITGQWQQRGARIEMDFDNPGTASAIYIFGSQFASVGSVGYNGGSASFAPNKYSFFATVNGNGKRLQVQETGGIKVDASAAAAGVSNTCKYNINIKRTYKGVPAPLAG
jgi:hypothetical protein